MLHRKDGQVLLIVVLVMIIALTVGLSIISRSITSLRTSTEEAASQKALAAAEAGVEQALKTGLDIREKQFGVGNITYQTGVEEVTGGNIVLNGGNPVLKDDGIDLWLSDYSTDSNNLYANPIGGNMQIVWGDPSKTDCAATGNNAPSAIEIMIIYNKASPTIRRFAFDPCSTRRTNNNFSAPTVTGTDITYSNGVGQTTLSFAYRTPNINLVSGGNAIIARITPLYADAIMGALKNGGANFPSQGRIVTSTGTANNEGTKRTIQVFQGYPKIPTEFFPYTIFSP